MHGAVDLVLRQRNLQLAGEQTLRADLVERLIELLVARCLESHDLGVNAAREKRGLDQSSLPKCELRRASPDSYGVRIRLLVRRHCVPPRRARRWSHPLPRT